MFGKSFPPAQTIDWKYRGEFRSKFRRKFGNFVSIFVFFLFVQQKCNVGLLQECVGPFGPEVSPECSRECPRKRAGVSEGSSVRQGGVSGPALRAPGSGVSKSVRECPRSVGGILRGNFPSWGRGNIGGILRDNFGEGNCES